MPGIKAKPNGDEAPAPAAERGDHDAFVADVGRLVRLARAKRGMTRRQLAQGSGASERYLAQIESGQGNPTVIILKSIAEALDVPIIDLLPRSNGRTAAMTHILDLLGRMPLAELPAIAELIESRAGGDAATDRARRIALVGLRGAGKSTLGQRLARELGCPFIELDRLVEQEYGDLPPLRAHLPRARHRRARGGGHRDRRRHRLERGDLRAVAAPHPRDLAQGAA
jgi:XRE family aerobic/anaerobic benzoate catabolism transcriptional regulator